MPWADVVRALAWGILAGGIVTCAAIVQTERERASETKIEADLAAMTASAARGVSAAGGPPNPFVGWDRE